MPKNKSKDESTPVFIPHNNGHNVIKAKERFREKEIKLLPSKLSNGFVPRKKNSIRPTVTTVAAEIHEQPFNYIPPETSEHVVDNRAMTVFSIFSGRSRSGKSNLNNGFVPNGYINVPQADTGNSQVCITVEAETETESSFIVADNEKSCNETVFDKKIDENQSKGVQSVAIKVEDVKSVKEDAVKDEESIVKDGEEIIVPVNRNSVPETSLDINGVNDNNFIKDSKNSNLEMKEMEKKASKKKVVIATPPTSAMSTRRLATAVRPARVSSAEEIKPVYRMTDLRRMLQPQEEVKDLETTLKAFWESVLDCQCFEWNFNNAAKLITVAVLVLTIIMIINALTKNR